MTNAITKTKFIEQFALKWFEKCELKMLNVTNNKIHHNNNHNHNTQHSQ